MRRIAVALLLVLLGVVGVDLIDDAVDADPAEVTAMEGPGDIPPTPHP